MNEKTFEIQEGLRNEVKASKNMVEELNRSLKYKISQEVKKQTIDLRKSPFDEGGASDSHSVGMIESMVGRMAIKTDMVE